MERVHCPDHGDTVRNLLQGRLDDREALAAEALTSTCDFCQGWWQRQLSAPALSQVDDAVAAALASFSPPRAPALRRWLPASAAAVLALLGGWALLLGPGGDQSPGNGPAVAVHTLQEPASATIAGTPGAAPDRPLIAAWDFEDGELPAPARAPEAAAGQTPARPLFADGLESGDLAAWSPTG